MPLNTTYSYQYYPIVIEKEYSISRNELYNALKKENINTRKYFYPLCSDFDCYKDLASSSPDNVPIANDLKNKVLCLPFYGELKENSAEFICKIIKVY